MRNDAIVFAFSVFAAVMFIMWLVTINAMLRDLDKRTTVLEAVQERTK